MSHFSVISTNLQNYTVLLESLKFLGLTLGNDTSKTSIIIKNNGSDFFFKYNGKTFDLVADSQFWYQTIPFEIFLEKVQYQYNYTKIMNQVQKHGFFVTQKIKTKVGVKTLLLEKWN
jgi:hypothetical protein